MKSSEGKLSHWYNPKKDKTIVNYMIDDVDYTTEENIEHILKFIKEQLKDEDLIFDLYSSFHEDEFNENGFVEFEKIIKKESNYIDKIYSNNKYRMALFLIKSEKLTLDFFKNIIKYYSDIEICYNIKNIDYNSFFKCYKSKNRYSLKNNYERILLSDFLILIRRNTNTWQSDIDIKMLEQKLKYKND